jgi:hypothetical protein
MGFCWVSSGDSHQIVGIVKVATHWNVINVFSEWVGTHLVGRRVRIHDMFFIQKIVPCVIKENIKPVPVMNLAMFLGFNLS